MSFGAPILAWAAVATTVVLVVCFAFDFTWRRRQLERIGHGPMLLRMIATFSPRRRVLRISLLVVAATAVVAALARPQVEGTSTWRQRGIDVAVVMDFSKSMLARDVYPSRYERMVFEADDLIAALEASRVSTVTFAGAAVHFPLTDDHDAAKLLYRGLEPADLSPGSNLSEAFRVARCVLRPDVQDAGCERLGVSAGAASPWLMCGRKVARAKPVAQEPAISDRGRAIVIFTDGEDTEGSAEAEIEAAVALGIEVFIVGIGTQAGELIPEYDDSGEELGWKKDADGTFVTTRLDQAGLKRLAAAAGAEERYFWLDGKRYRRGELTERLEKLKKGDLDERVVYKPKEVYQWFLFPAFLLLIIEACIGERRKRATVVIEERTLE